jgi:penicillin V acylase-like amidase (Ntn superfamily)
MRALHTTGKLTATSTTAVNEFTDLFAKTIGATLPEPTHENVIERLEILRSNIVPFGTVQPVADQTAKQALAKFMSTRGSAAYLVPNLQKCIFNNFNFDKTADIIKRVNPVIQKSKKAPSGRTGKKRTQKHAHGK